VLEFNIALGNNRGMSDRRRIFDDQLYCHFVTFSCDGRRNLLDPDPPKRLLLGIVAQQLQRHNATCAGFVIMPNHVHVLLRFSEPGQLSLFMQQWKRLASHAIRNWYREEGRVYLQKVGSTERIWTPKYYSFEVDSEDKLEEKLTYMHLNPVRAGLVLKAVDWRWSSARWYEQGRTVGLPIHWPGS